MKLTRSKIEEVIISIAGTEGLRLVRELKSKENISEFVLATNLKRDIKIVRNLLYKLYNYNLISSIRKKDKQKGWYIYYWTLIPDNIKFLYLKNKKVELIKLKARLKKEQTEQFYTCPKKCIRLDFDQAIDFEFRCPECGELISHHHDPKIIIKLEKRIFKLEEELKNAEKEKLMIKKIQKKKIIKEELTKEKTAKKTIVKKKATKKKPKKKKIKKKSVKKKVVKKKSTIKKIKLKKPSKKTSQKKNKPSKKGTKPVKKKSKKKIKKKAIKKK
ncbi:hypothetical protein GOV03_02830 [Candidatus Woesearchaeota archaeon]|nr:hypothetical protein [Candidatus Woesearchaeota archaeon]